MQNQIQPYNYTHIVFRDNKNNKNIIPEIALPNTDINNQINKEKMGVDWTSGLGLTVLAIIGGSLMFSRGVQKNSSKYLNKMKEFFENKLELSGFEDSNKKAKFYEYSIRRINSFLHKSESINNITSLKDILFMKLMYKTKPTQKIHNSITKYFEGLSRKTVEKSYEKAGKYFKKMNTLFDNLDKKILENNPEEIFEYDKEKLSKRELIERAKDHREIASLFIYNFIDKTSQNQRYEYMDKLTSTLYSKFWDASFKDFWSKDNKFKKKEMWQTFIAAEQIKGDKTHLVKNINYARELLAYTDSYITDLINNNINELSTLIPLTDKKGYEIVEKIKYLAETPQAMVDNKKYILAELEKLKTHKISTVVDQEIIKVQEEYKENCIDTIKRQIEDRGNGILQDVISIYNTIAPYELAKSGARNALKQTVEQFDESVKLESIELFDKVRDLKLGSAPTDVLTILVSFIMISFGLGNAKDNSERTSIMLKSGIPIAGAIATSIISATKLVSGGKSLALGFLSGIILNKLGNYADKGLKHYQAKSKP